MPTSQGHRDLFRNSNTVDKLNFLQSLLELKDLIPDLALALINIIRAELEQPHKQSPSAYRRYAEVITSLCIQVPEVYGQVVSRWQQRHPVVLARPSASLTQDPEPPATSASKPPQTGRQEEHDTP